MTKRASFSLIVLLIYNTALSIPASPISLPEKSGIIHFDLTLEEGAKPFHIWMETPIKNGGNEWVKNAGVRLVPDSEGREIPFVTQNWNKEDNKWEPEHRDILVFWPKGESRQAVSVKGMKPRSWHGKRLHGSIQMSPRWVGIWLEGQLILNAHLPERGGRLQIQAGEGAKINIGETRELYGDGQWVPVDLGALIPAEISERTINRVQEIPFEIRDEGKTLLSLEEAGWSGWKDEPGSFYEAYDEGMAFLGDLRQPLVQVPNGDYVAAYLLAYAEKNEAITDQVTLRLGRRKQGVGPQSQVLMRDYGASVPQKGKNGELHLIRIPLDGTLKQRVEGDILDMEITKEIRLARKAPDPNRFRWRPLGLPSGVKIAAITLERSPLSVEISPAESGSLFPAKDKVRFTVNLTNTTGKPQPFTLRLSVGEQKKVESGEVSPGQTMAREMIFDAMEPGHYTLLLQLSGVNDIKLAEREWFFGVLPEGERKWREMAPWGTWDNCGASVNHFSPNNPEKNASVTEKLGFRYGLFFVEEALRRKAGVLKGNSLAVRMGAKEPEKTPERFRELLEKDLDQPHELLIFHEDGISGEHASRIPDLFSDRPAYQLNEEEKQQFEKMWRMAESVTKAMRREWPGVKLYLGNGGMTLREEFYRRGFPAELFDVAGNENASFSRIPESQPPDVIANNASLWMDRQLLDAYGYHDKPVAQCYETIYPSSNPGNLSYRTQADYFIRNILHSMAWKVPRISPGGIADSGNTYYHSNWGGVGFMTRRPEFTPKPAALAMATLTLVLDGAEYDGFVETGSESVYLSRFRKKDGSLVFPYWVVRGERDLHLQISGAKEVEVVSAHGRRSRLEIINGNVTVKASASPEWLTLQPDAEIEAVSLGRPIYPDDTMQGKITLLHKLESLEGWKLEETRNPVLENYNPMTPRRKGNVEVVVDEGIRIRPLPCGTGKETMPMYAEFVHEKGIPLQGKPAEITIQVEGNSAWGRIIFELEDAKGQRWTSIGARATGVSSEWMADWVGKERATAYIPGEQADWNTDDAWGLSRINFDGWRHVNLPLPGQYPGEGYRWPANSQWRWDGDGIVHYPLVLKKLIVELPEKTLYLTRYVPANNPWIRLRNLASVEREIDSPKNLPGDYDENVQTTIK